MTGIIRSLSSDYISDQTPTRSQNHHEGSPFMLNSGHLHRLNPELSSPLLFSRSGTRSRSDSPFALTPYVTRPGKSSRLRSTLNISTPSRPCNEDESEEPFKSWIKSIKTKAKRALDENERSEEEFSLWIKRETRMERKKFEINQPDSINSVAFNVLETILNGEKLKREEEQLEHLEKMQNLDRLKRQRILDFDPSESTAFIPFSQVNQEEENNSFSPPIESIDHSTRELANQSHKQNDSPSKSNQFEEPSGLNAALAMTPANIQAVVPDLSNILVTYSDPALSNTFSTPADSRSQELFSGTLPIDPDLMTSSRIPFELPPELPKQPEYALLDLGRTVSEAESANNHRVISENGDGQFSTANVTITDYAPAEEPDHIINDQFSGNIEEEVAENVYESYEEEYSEDYDEEAEKSIYQDNKQDRTDEEYSEQNDLQSASLIEDSLDLAESADENEVYTAQSRFTGKSHPMYNTAFAHHDVNDEEAEVSEGGYEGSQSESDSRSLDQEMQTPPTDEKSESEEGFETSQSESVSESVSESEQVENEIIELSSDDIEPAPEEHYTSDSDESQHSSNEDHQSKYPASKWSTTSSTRPKSLLNSTRRVNRYSDEYTDAEEDSHESQQEGYDDLEEHSDSDLHSDEDEDEVDDEEEYQNQFQDDDADDSSEQKEEFQKELEVALSEAGITIESLQSDLSGHDSDTNNDDAGDPLIEEEPQSPLVHESDSDPDSHFPEEDDDYETQKPSL
ncbi:uncharacterized protein V1516DRAFT_677931 [Lipomyces oligophaga]|uniref:uncharacterized protein n=1 Tax=Lipomyces oligophaga TaxID=45792 RepID=UPI0034CD6077